MLQTTVGLLSLDRFRAERYSYVLLGDETIFVFRAAREAIGQTGAVFSLHQFYRKYAHDEANAANEASLLDSAESSTR